MGVQGIELKWFTDYLSDRIQRVKHGCSYSNWGPVLGGIPQGSALGPLLFLIYVNNMPLQVQHGSLLQYADDTCLICCGDSHHSVAHMISEDLESLSGWIVNSKMLINFTKSSIMWFHARSPNSIILPTITVDGHSLVHVDSQKYLGLHIDSKLSWRNHVANICKKMAYYLYLIVVLYLKVLLRCRWSHSYCPI